MNIEALKKALRPKLHEIDVEGIKLYIHRPAISDTPKCNTFEGVIIHCVKDADGNSLFTDDVESELMQVSDIDQTMANDIYIKVLALLTVEDEADSTEKK